MAAMCFRSGTFPAAPRWVRSGAPPKPGVREVLRRGRVAQEHGRLRHGQVGLFSAYVRASARPGLRSCPECDDVVA